MRAHQRYLGWPPVARPVSDEDLAPVKRVEFNVAARRQLTRHLHACDHPYSGLLFGYRTPGVLHIVFVSPPAYPQWSVEAPRQHRPLDLDSRYVLGLSDAVAADHGPEVDWQGNWLAYRDARLREEREDLLWLTRGAEQGLFSDEHILVAVGWEEGALAGRAYAHDEGEAVRLAWSFETSK